MDEKIATANTLEGELCGVQQQARHCQFQNSWNVAFTNVIQPFNSITLNFMSTKNGKDVVCELQ